MQALFNIVGTNSMDGDHTALQRWYADHVHLLFRFEGLHAATLLQRSDVQTGLTATNAACHYLCLYRFESAEAFAQFEVSDVRSSAPKLGAPEWMKSGIHIATRQQYRMVTSRSLSPFALAAGNVHLRSVRLPAAEPLALERWMQGGVHAALQQPGVNEVKLMHCTKAAEGQMDYLSLVGSSGATAPDVFAAESTPGLGDPPASVQTLWEAAYRSTGHWFR
jgi:hypothetical protein